MAKKPKAETQAAEPKTAAPINTAAFNVHVAKAGADVTVNLDTLPEASRQYLLIYGIKQCLNDVHAGVKKDQADAGAQALALINARIADLVSGNPPSVGARGSRKDPVLEVMDSIARERIVAALKAAGKSWRSVAKDKREAAVDAYVAKNEASLRDEANARLATKANPADVDALADLGL